jgi:hypothetical protein
MSRKTTTPPRVETRTRHAVAGTQRVHSKTVLRRLDEGKDLTLRAEQNRMALFSSSSSSLSNVFCRFNSASCRTSRARRASDATPTRARSVPSRASFRQRESMSGCTSSASATSCTRTPSSWLSLTAFIVNPSLCRLTFFGPLILPIQTHLPTLGQSVHFIGATSVSA